MADGIGKQQSLFATMIGLWQRLPVVARALVVGFLVAEIGIGAWLAVATLIPAPWSLVLMSTFLWAYWRYFSGNGGSKSTAEGRRIRFRSTKITAAIWKWGTLAAILFVVIVQSGFVLTFRVTEFPAEAFAAGYGFSDLPPWLAWLFIVMASLVAGVCEEIGFRGYMQVPLDRVVRRLCSICRFVLLGRTPNSGSSPANVNRHEGGQASESQIH